MSEHAVTIEWKHGLQNCSYETYCRDHEWRFDSGTTVPASAAKDYFGSESCVDPEEAFVASLSSCHMLTFLAICAKRNIVIDSYVDHAVGVLEKDAEGRLAITRVTLRPQARFSGEKIPAEDELRKLHDRAHHACFIANSVKTEVRIEPA